MNAASPLVTAAVALIVGLFGGGTLIALLRVRVDKNQVVVSAAQGAVIVQSGVIDDLQDELGRVKKELAELRQERNTEQAELRTLREENRAMRVRLAALEAGK